MKLLRYRMPKRGIILISFLTLFLLLLTTTYFLSQWVNAQLSGQSLEVSSPSQEVNADPGSTVHIKAKIRNSTQNTLPLSVHIEDFTASGDEGQVALTQGGPYSVAYWTKLTPEKFTLAPQEEKEVTATITIPKDAAGGRYGSFIFGIDTKKEGGTTALSQQIASLFLLRISGDVEESLILKEIKVPSFSEFGPIQFKLGFENTGNIHVKTYGLLNITDMFGRRVTDIVVPPTNIFPQASRNITTSLEKTYLFGRYTATAVLYYGSMNEPVYGNTTFIVFPIRIVVPILIVVCILFFLRKRILRALRILLKG